MRLLTVKTNLALSASVPCPVSGQFKNGLEFTNSQQDRETVIRFSVFKANSGMRGGFITFVRG